MPESYSRWGWRGESGVFSWRHGYKYTASMRRLPRAALWFGPCRRRVQLSERSAQCSEWCRFSLTHTHTPSERSVCVFALFWQLLCRTSSTLSRSLSVFWSVGCFLGWSWIFTVGVKIFTYKHRRFSVPSISTSKMSFSNDMPYFHRVRLMTNTLSQSVTVSEIVESSSDEGKNKQTKQKHSSYTDVRH